MATPLNSPRPTLLALAVTALMIAPLAHADGTADPSARTLDTVKVTADGEIPNSYAVKGARSATKLDLSLRETPQSVTVITRQRLDDMGLFSLSDVMGQVTGVSVSVTDSERINYVSRGYTIENFQIDGMLNTFGGSVKTNTDNVIYERIEVIRGATGLTTGAGDPSGTISMIRKRPTDTFQMGANLTVGRWNNRRLEADLGGPVAWDGRIRARLVAAKQQSDSFRDVYALDKDVFYGIVQADLSDSTLFEVGYEYQSPRTTGVTWGVVPYWGADGAPANLPRSTNLSASWSAWPIVEKTSFARLEQQLGNGWSVKGNLSHAVRDTDGSVWYGAAGNPRADGSGVTAYISHFNEHSTMDVFDVNVGGPFQLFGREHELVFGLGQAVRKGESEGMDFDYDDAYAVVPDWRHWTGEVPVLPVTRLGRLSSQNELRQRAAYAAARLRLADPLLAVVGARYGSWETRSWAYGYDANGNRNRTTRTGYRPDDMLTPYAGLIYDFNSIFSGYVSYTDIFKPQNYRDRNGNYLEPVVGSMYEAGVKAEFFGGLLNASAAVFEGKQDNVAEIDDSVPVNSLPDGSQAYRSTGKGNKVKGWEIETQGSIGEQWNISAGFAHTVIRNKDGVLQRTTAPQDTFRLNTSWRPGGIDGRFWLGGGVTWQSRIWNTSTKPDRSKARITQDAFHLVNLAGGYRFNENFSAQLNINNLLDKKYFNNVGFYNGVYWGEPRNVTVTLRWKL
ncbi:MAG: TonB-dependent siderophore receptor [Stenotrophomonas sp.]|jgi:outer membrane receptor for ferric coprogen and ferric-rhodotorulic acid|uniref:TonB-dependent siderophore receptor n=1 Tax=Stenotrophomonas TaxID=40323 RepID=UPI00201CD685|nr:MULTISPECIES: TonB-dependent siderophore receptor [Stenotrophomonas]MBN5025128.1 TonB-dependent siderophore receptor [Stenotrophomonas maltophilia]MDH1274277.1 TonB-dependent siderophore receptor [Stenotrophomonas sp. GD03937]MDH1486485.1 TonB-dependent siderophore receptor [Stenotrophomonas sp. GD03712]MDR2961005.1 TonB-dependent siderophore receptor [Stenotrophomonas sp.]UQY97470.1 TonB-dependent siderophore receptor [Stenotrophomonas maltophilia]